MLDALFCITDLGDEVILTDPTYAGMVNRVRLVAAVPRLARLVADSGEWRLDLDALRAAATRRARVVFINNASFPTGWVASDSGMGRDRRPAVSMTCGCYWAGFEGVLYDGRTARIPAGLPGMRERTVTIGGVSLETADDCLAHRLGGRAG